MSGTVSGPTPVSGSTGTAVRVPSGGSAGVPGPVVGGGVAVGQFSSYGSSVATTPGGPVGPAVGVAQSPAALGEASGGAVSSGRGPRGVAGTEVGLGGTGCGGGTTWSCLQSWSISRSIQVLSTTSMIVMLVRSRSLGATANTRVGRYPGQGRPPTTAPPRIATGGVKGLPQAQRTRGRPRSSTRTAVPAWRTAWKPLARPAR